MTNILSKQTEYFHRILFFIELNIYHNRNYQIHNRHDIETQFPFTVFDSN